MSLRRWFSRRPTAEGGDTVTAKKATHAPKAPKAPKDGLAPIEGHVPEKAEKLAPIEG